MSKSLLSKWLELNQKSEKLEKEDQSSEYPLSYNQQSLYFLYKLYPENPFYNYSDLYQFQGDVDLDVLKKSFEYLANRHEVFRTRFEMRTDGPIQIIDKQSKIEFIEHSLEEHDQSLDSARQLIVADAKRPFDLAEAQQLRLSMVNVKNELLVGVTVHHIIIDKWSMFQFREELSTVYQQLKQDKEVILSAIPTTFAKYAKKQINLEKPQNGLDFWLNRIDQDSSPIELPFDRQRPMNPSFQGAHYTQNVEIHCSNKIKALGLELNVTSFVIFYSAFIILLRKLGNHGSINVGIPVTNKDSAELEKVLGFFDETIILSSQALSGNKIFSDLVTQQKSDVFEAFDHKDVPLELLIREMKPERIAGLNPLFQVMFIFNKAPDSPDFGNDIDFKGSTVDIGVTKFDLTLFIGENDQGFYTSFEYATDLFNPETIVKLSDYYHNILDQVITNPTIEISEIHLLKENQLELIENWQKGPEISTALNESIIEVIKASAANYPKEIAVSDIYQSITYEELDKQSDQIASFLLNKKCERGDIIGLHFGRRIEMVISMIGVMKAGCAYMPLDPKYPIDRIQFMINDSGCNLVIDGIGMEEIDPQLRVPYASISANHEFPHNIEVTKEDPAYVIYTSGSTGKPKGVLINQRNLINSTLSRSAHYQDKPTSFLLLSSFSFDSSIAGIFWTLCSGGKLVIAPERIEQDMGMLLDLIGNEGITHTLLLPTLYQVLLSHIDPSQSLSLECLIVAGEECSTSLVTKHFKVLPKVRLYNEYGPTEATVWATGYEVKNQQYRKIPIGRPIANTRIYILDQDYNPVPQGVKGELFIAGMNVTEGYLNADQLTDSKFVADPFSRDHSKMYKTGDLAMYNASGEIVFCGRVDEQVKLRGYRIELNEIKEEVDKQPGVKESIVLITEGKRDQEDISHLLDLKDEDQVRLLEELEFVEGLSEEEAGFLLRE